MGSPEPPRRYRHSHDAAFMAGYDTPPEFTPDEPVPPDGTRLQEIRRRWATTYDRGAHDYTDEGCRVLAEHGFKDVAFLLERVNQLEQENERLFLQDAQHRAMYVKEYDKVNQLEAQVAALRIEREVDQGEIACLVMEADALEKAYDLLASAYAHLEGGQRAKAERLRAAAHEALSAAGEGAE